MNKVFLTGRLSSEVNLKTYNEDKCWATFSLAVQKPYSANTKDGKNTCDFFNIKVWNKQAENCRKYLSKGSQVAIMGTLTTNSYEKDNIKRTIYEINADNVEFMGGKASDSGTAPKKKDDSYKDLMTELPDDDEGMPF